MGDKKRLADLKIIIAILQHNAAMRAEISPKYGELIIELININNTF